MGEDNVLTIKMAELGVVESPYRLKTTLGSCVGVILRDSRQKRSGLAHIMLPEKTGRDTQIGKYAETAIPELLRRLEALGSGKRALVAYIVGGARMFPGGASDIAMIGQRNIDTSKKILGDMSIPIVFEDTGGTAGRMVLFESEPGTCTVKTLAIFKSSWSES